ncbi:Cell cycle serine/threonine-protein kinase cdc5/MSD2 [Ascosphaera aggregata]|nr:Cell cycle serine/threonine-protein kinase cdc5/MSD2 [Ascosphaera aggregata]
MAVKALSPRPTNILRRPKSDMEKHPSAKPAVEVRKQASAPKPHAAPPPAVVREPTEDGEEYITGKFLGKGGFAICYEGRLVRNNRVFALKVVKSEMSQRKMAEKFRTELQIHSKLQHPNIVGFHRAFAFEKSIYVVLELCSNGSVMDMVKKRKCLTLPEVRRFMIQLCGAVKYMHRRCVAHRDLKMGNLFLDRDMNIKVGDFGLAACIISEKDEKRRRTLCGTPNYIAPEVLDKSKGGHNQKVDIWSIGVIFFAMLTGIPPFQSKTQDEIYRKVKTLTYGWPKESECLNDIPPEAKDIVKCCLNLDEDERPEPDDIVDHPFFNMYIGCIPREPDRSILTAMPAWVKKSSPRGDRIITGYSLNHDPKYKAEIRDAHGFEESYIIAKDRFYSECGVGRNAAGYLRRSVGTRPTRSVYAECVTEENYGLQPVIPLPENRIYTPFLADEDDWAEGADEADVSPTTESLPQPMNGSSQKLQALNMARTQSALAAAQNRLKESKPQSHAAVMRQQALPLRPAIRETRSRTNEDKERYLSKGVAVTRSQTSSNLVSEPAARLKQTSAGPAIPSSSKRSHIPDPIEVHSQPGKSSENPKSPSASALTKGQMYGKPDPHTAGQYPSRRQDYKKGAMDERLKSRQPYLKGSKSANMDPYAPPPDAEAGNHIPSSSNPAVAAANVHASTRSRSNIGSAPLIHPDEPSEIMPGTTAAEVMHELERYLISLSSYDDPEHTANIVKARKRERRTRMQPHSYVVKWVDYTNRYGIGYVLDDGSVGCVFKAEHGGPASGVVVRQGETHIRRKARAKKSPKAAERYPDVNQLVPRNGADIEFYESLGPSSEHFGGLRRTLVPPQAFEVKTSGRSSAVRIRQNLSIGAAKSEAEKVRRVKLVDQFGKYMIGSLGTSDDDDDGKNDTPPSTHYVKFYQRLGNVGVWGFGDGAFQFNFPDHTKLVLSHAKHDQNTPVDPLACQIDFYHLSASAARYLLAKGKMHPSGFETRAVACDDVSTYFAALQKGQEAPSKLSDVLEANAFPEKVDFIRTVLESWTRSRKLGAQVMPPYSHQMSRKVVGMGEIFWEGAQEKTWIGPTGSKFVWVTVGAHDGDNEYLAVTFRRNPENGEVQCSGAGSLRELGDRLMKLTL